MVAPGPSHTVQMYDTIGICMGVGPLADAGLLWRAARYRHMWQMFHGRRDVYVCLSDPGGMCRKGNESQVSCRPHLGHPLQQPPMVATSRGGKMLALVTHGRSGHAHACAPSSFALNKHLQLLPADVACTQGQ